MRQLYLFPLFILFGNIYFSFAQNNTNCINALEITDPTGLYSFEKKKNTLWFKFETKFSTDFTFDISPLNSNSDLDFFLFRYDGEDFCEKINSKKITPVRMNLSRYDSIIADKTGLSFSGSKELIAEGPGDAYAKSLKIEKGEKYYLMINNYTKNAGSFLLQFYFKDTSEIKSDTVDIGIALPEKKDKEIISEEKKNLNITVMDEEGNPVKGDIYIEGIQEKPLRINGKKKYTIALKKAQNITVNCNAGGYLFYSNSLSIPNKFENINLEIKLKKIRVGENIILPQIKFEPDNAEFLSSSVSSLMNLSKFLQDNPNVKIEIQGHVNGPDSRNSIELKKISKARARAVYKYLLTNGINKTRLSYKGFGNAFMIYPKPDRETQSEQNRRVEVKILSIN